MELSKRAKRIKPSATMKVAALATTMKSKGIDVINFGVGEPDFNTPQHIKDAGKKAIDDNFTKYTKAAGVDELRELIAAKLKRENNLDYTANQIVVSPGAKASLFYSMFAILSKGDKVIVPSPYWVTYPAQVELCDACPVILDTSEANDFKITPQQLSDKIKEEKGVKVLILNSPSNPTGSLYSRDELFAIADVCLKNSVAVISDEIYEKLIYGSEEFESIAKHSSQMKDNTLVINGVSKSFSMTGWRMGYTAGPQDIIAKITSIQSQVSSNINSISQKACIAALAIQTDDVEKMRVQFDKRRKFLVGQLSAIDGVSCSNPLGAFYAFPNVSSFVGGKIKDDVELCTYLLENYHIAIVPGSAFGADGFVRFSYATSMENIQKGLERFKKGLDSLR